jgi:hypothetical protein
MNNHTTNQQADVNIIGAPAFGNANRTISVGIVGGAGYTGGELIRLLVNHPNVALSFIHSRSNAGNAVSAVHQDLLGDTDLQFTDELSDNIDVLFLCVGHGEAKKFLSDNEVDESVKVIDLSQDFRLTPNATFNNRKFVYGLPELNREEIAKASNIANPGCFATGIQLGLLPLASEGLLDNVYTTGITGSTGAGQSLPPPLISVGGPTTYKPINHWRISTCRRLHSPCRRPVLWRRKSTLFPGGVISHEAFLFLPLSQATGKLKHWLICIMIFTGIIRSHI